VPPIQDLTGQVFGRLTAVSHVGTNKYRYALWLCRCECGGEAIVSNNALRYGNTRSCGCLLHEGHVRAGKMTRHGQHGTPTYVSWQSMKGGNCRWATPPRTGEQPTTASTRAAWPRLLTATTRRLESDVALPQEAC
jgi:hypothetical protein